MFVMNKNKVMSDIKRTKQDLETLLQMKKMYESTNTICGGMYMDLELELDEQIATLEKWVYNLERNDKLNKKTL